MTSAKSKKVWKNYLYDGGTAEKNTNSEKAVSETWCSSTFKARESGGADMTHIDVTPKIEDEIKMIGYKLRSHFPKIVDELNNGRGQIIHFKIGKYKTHLILKAILHYKLTRNNSMKMPDYVQEITKRRDEIAISDLPPISITAPDSKENNNQYDSLKESYNEGKGIALLTLTEHANPRNETEFPKEAVIFVVVGEELNTRQKKKLVTKNTSVGDNMTSGIDSVEREMYGIIARDSEDPKERYKCAKIYLAWPTKLSAQGTLVPPPPPPPGKPDGQPGGVIDKKKVEEEISKVPGELTQQDAETDPYKLRGRIDKQYEVLESMTKEVYKNYKGNDIDPCHLLFPIVRKILDPLDKTPSPKQQNMGTTRDWYHAALGCLSNQLDGIGIFYPVYNKAGERQFLRPKYETITEALDEIKKWKLSHPNVKPMTGKFAPLTKVGIETGAYKGFVVE